MDINPIDLFGIILYNGAMLNTKEIQKVLKVLLRKSKGLSRLKRIDEMDRGLAILNMYAVRQKRHSGMSFVSYETIDYIDALLKRAKHTRENPKRILKQFALNY